MDMIKVGLTPLNRPRYAGDYAGHTGPDGTALLKMPSLRGRDGGGKGEHQISEKKCGILGVAPKRECRGPTTNLKGGTGRSKEWWTRHNRHFGVFWPRFKKEALQAAELEPTY